ncbi:MAG: MFS family permease [Candidatus Azotimanducaceae bacterium]|jgi:MFS family permease
MSSIQALRRSLFLVSLPLFFINFVLPIKSKALGASAFEIGGLFSLFTFSLVLLRPLVGIWIDRIGRKVFFVVALLLYSMAYLGYAWSEGLAAMYIARFCQGIGASLLLIAVDTITTDLTLVAERGQALGRNVETQTRASMLGATIGFTLVGAIPVLAWQYSFYLFACAALIGFFVAMIGLKQTLPSAKKSTEGSYQVGEGLKRFLLVLILLGFASSVIQPIFLVYLQDEFTTDVRLLAWAFLPMGILYTVLPSRTGRLSDRFGPNNVIIIGAAIAAMVYLVIPLIQGYWWLVLVYTGSAVGWALIEPARKAFVANHGDQSNIAKNFGMSEFAFGIGATLGPLAGGYLYDKFDFSMPLIATTIVLASVVLLVKFYIPQPFEIK